MSELWDRCRALLRDRMSEPDWRSSIAPLRAWMDDRALYLWVDRADDDYRSLPNPAHRFAGAIREVAAMAWAYPATAVHFLDRPPNRERVINERRVRAHREQERRRQDADHHKLLRYAQEECRNLYREAGHHRIGGTAAEKISRLQAIAIARAKRRLEREQMRVPAAAARTSPPTEPPLLPRRVDDADPVDEVSASQSPAS